MSTLYVESSALLAWMFGEPDGERIREEIGSANTVATSALTFLEAERALLRADRSGRRSRVEGTVSLRGALARQRRGWIVLGVDDHVLQRAGQAFPVEPLRTLDAIHLASAMRLAEVLPGLRVLTRDQRIRDNARALGLS